MQFIFGTSDKKEFKDFFDEVLEYLSEEEKEWVPDSTKKNFNESSAEEYFRFLYYHYGEEFIKYHIASNFDITFYDDLFENNEYFNNLQIIKSYYTVYQKYNFFLYEDEGRVVAVIDMISDGLFSWFKNNLNFQEIDIHFAKKDDILKKIQEVFEIELTSLSVTSNKNTTYSPSALDLNYLSKSSLIKIGFFFALFILLSFKSVFFVVFSIAIFNISYLISIFYKFFLSLVSKGDDNKSESTGIKGDDKNNNYPIYTILLPLLYEEKSIVMQLVAAIRNLNYPQHQLDIKLLLEESDQITLAVISSLKLEYNFDLIIVPDGEKYGHPKTKARACNYGFNFVKGEYLVIYDGDDVPHPEQIVSSLRKFQENPELKIIQYSLNSYNHNINILTKFYSTEFDLWYKVFLPSVKELKMPLTLGGTSNHFKIDVLKDNLWDSYNLTEDADLGIRLWLNGIDNICLRDEFPTMEEAPQSMKSLVKQRSRWIKGFIQTYFVHIKYKFKEIDSWRKIKFLTFTNFFMILPIFANLSFFPNIFEFILLKFFHKQDGAIILIGTTVFILFLISFVFQLLPILFHREKMIVKVNSSTILFPIYTIVLNVLASYKALWQFFTKPFYWEKTAHGINSEEIKKNE